MPQFGSEEHLSAYLYYEDHDRYQIVVNYQKEERLQGFLKELSANCGHYFHKHNLEESIRIGVGHPVKDVSEIYQSAEQANNTINVAAMHRIHRTVSYQEIAPYLETEYIYPLSEEVRFSRAIVNGNAGTAKQVLRSIIESNRLRDQLTDHGLWLLYLDLYFTVAHSGQSLGIVLPPQKQSERALSLDDIHESIRGMVNHICNQIYLRRQVNLDEAELKIFSYIDENLYDPNLSLNSIAEAFSRSQAYISTIFKEHRGVNYNTYINQMRIKRAVELMTEGVDINAVWPMVGYISQSTFRRNYSKYTKQT